MVPIDEVVTLSTAVDSDENLRRMVEQPHTRYPLVGEELVEGDVDFARLAAPPMTLSPDVDVSDAIDQFQAESQELALVIEDGDVVGMVTVIDLLESVMGDIEDPIDVECLQSG